MPAITKHLANVSAYAEAIYALTQGACTIPDLVAESGMASNTARKFVASLRRRGLLYIAAWEKDTTGRFTVAAYAWGDTKDVKRPPNKTMEERKAKYMKKIRAIALHTGTPVRQTRVRNHTCLTSYFSFSPSLK
jgi:hypothetical protein